MFLLIIFGPMVVALAGMVAAKRLEDRGRPEFWGWALAEAAFCGGAWIGCKAALAANENFPYGAGEDFALLFGGIACALMAVMCVPSFLRAVWSYASSRKKKTMCFIMV